MGDRDEVSTLGFEVSVVMVRWGLDWCVCMLVRTTGSGVERSD